MDVYIENSRIMAVERCESMILCEKIAEKSNLHCEIHERESDTFPYSVIWKGSDAVDYIAHKKEKLEFLQPLIPVGLTSKFKLMSDDAVKPAKAHTSDSGWDLTLIKMHKQQGMITFYSTDIAIEPPHGYYFDLVARSSLSKTGYILANSVGIIDQSYRGPIIAALMKIDQSMPDIKLPCKCVQLILRPWFNCEFQDINVTDTNRNIGGFGSTN